MPKLYPQNQCEACLFRPVMEDQMAAHFLERISELESENENLRKLEGTIRRNSHLFDVLLRASHEAILLLSPELTIVRLIHSTLGYSEKNLLGVSVLAFIHSDDANLLEDSCANLLRSRAGKCAIELRALGPDGKWTWLAGELTDMLDDSNVQAIVMNMHRIDKPTEPASAEAS